MTRRTVDDDRRIVAFLGASRMAIGYDPRAFEAAAPEYRGVQLAISDHLAGGVLEDLAADETFRGVVVFDVIETEIADPLLMKDGRNYAAQARSLWRVPGAVANRWLGSLAQDHLAVLAVGGRRIITHLAGKRRWPTPAWVAMDRERTSRGDYELATAHALRDKAQRRLANVLPPITPAEWLAILERDFEPLVRKIKARGGDVVVIKMPISGGLARTIDELYPRERYWNAFAARTAAHVLHFKDLPAMADLTCPDEMHLDQRDQAAFTRALIEAMRRRGVLR